MLESWEQLRGHAEQRALFQRSRAHNRLSHAYVFCGPDGIGKRQFAGLLAQSLFCRSNSPDELNVCGTCRACRGFMAGSWPDFLEVRRPEGKSAIPIDLLVGADDRRGREGLCYELSMSPQASDRRIAIINDAHFLQADGANAILKTLEEPPAAALIILICRDVDSLLPTIRSRCQVIRFFPLPDSDVASILRHEGLVTDDSEATVIASMAEGSLTTAQQLLNPDLRKLKETMSEQLQRLEKMEPLVIAHRMADELERLSSNTEEQRQNAQWLLRFVADFLRFRLRKLTDGDLSDPLMLRLGVREGVDLLGPLLDRVVAATRQIEANSPVRLVLEAFFDQFARDIRMGPISSR